MSECKFVAQRLIRNATNLLGDVTNNNICE